jgi:phenylacetate-CoA ligase
MSPDGMVAILRFMKSFRPGFIFSYPSSLIHLIEHLNGDERAIRGLNLKAVLTSGEQLYEWQKQEIRRAFNAMVFNFYGCREVGIIAQECDRQTSLHVIPESVFLEVVDEDGNSVVGKEGEIIVTDLCNHVAPFIRYRIGDRGILLDETCPCVREGLPLLKVLGRTFGIIRSPAGGAVGGTFWTLLFKARPGIRRFRVVQDRIDHIRVDYIPDTDRKLTGESIRYFRERIGEKLPGLQVEFVTVDHIPLPPSGKQQFVISKLDSGARL